jgi:hypothetical protein
MYFLYFSTRPGCPEYFKPNFEIFPFRKFWVNIILLIIATHLNFDLVQVDCNAYSGTDEKSLASSTVSSEECARKCCEKQENGDDYLKCTVI